MHKASENTVADSEVRSDSETRKMFLRFLAPTVPKVNADLTNDTKSLSLHFPFCWFIFYKGPIFHRNRSDLQQIQRLHLLFIRQKYLPKYFSLKFVCPVILAFRVLAKRYITLVIPVQVKKQRPCQSISSAQFLRLPILTSITWFSLIMKSGDEVVRCVKQYTCSLSFLHSLPSF